MESLRMLINKSQVAPFFNTDYNKEFTKAFAVGETVRVKMPQRFLIRNGLGYSPQPISRNYTTVACDQIFGVDFEWDSAEAALKQERGEEAIKREYIEPAMNQIANELDSRCSQWAYQHTANISGVLGTTPTDFSPYRRARTIMNEQSAPPGNRGMIISPTMEENAVAAGVTYFNPTDAISKQYKEGSMGRAAGFDWYSSNNLYTHTAGTWAGAVTVTSNVADGATSLTITATAGDTFKVGDVISIGSVNYVNPVNRRTNGRAKTFVVTQDLTAAGGGADVLYVSAGDDAAGVFRGPGNQYQNVDALPLAGATLTLFPGTGTPSGKVGVNGIALSGDAYALVGVALEKPKATEITSLSRDPATGLSVRFVRMFDPVQSKMVNRFDVLCGFGNLYNEYSAVRVLSLA